MNICRFRACSSRKELIALRMCSRLSISVPTVASDTEGNQRSLLELIGKTNLKTQHISTLITHVRSEDMWCALEVKRVQVAGSKVRVVIRNFESILWFSDQLEPFPRKILFFFQNKKQHISTEFIPKRKKQTALLVLQYEVVRKSWQNWLDSFFLFTAAVVGTDV